MSRQERASELQRQSPHLRLGDTVVISDGILFVVVQSARGVARVPDLEHPAHIRQDPPRLAVALHDADAVPRPFVISHNLHRRHLTESQRGEIAGRLVTTQSVGFQGNQWCRSLEQHQITNNRAAEMLNVSEMTARRGRKVVEKGIPELADAVRDQKLSINAAAEIASHKPAEQRRRLKAHLDQGGSDKRQKGTPKMKATQTREPKLRVAYDRDDAVVDQVFSLLHRLREVSDRTTPEGWRTGRPAHRR